MTWFNTPSEGAIGFNVTVTPTVGAGSTRWPLFVEAVDRNGGTATLGYPSMITQWSGPQNAPIQAVIQGFSSGAFIIHDEQKDTPAGSVPAYVLSDPILQHFQSLQGSSSWLGAGPSSDQFTNAIGQQQSNFPNGYITWDGITAEAHAWPTHDVNQWYVEYHNGTNLNAGATWIENIPDDSIHIDWGYQAPGGGTVGVWTDTFSTRWTKTVYLLSGAYEFFAYGDDRLRVYLNNSPLMIATYLEPSTIRKTLAAGYYTFRLEHEENSGGAQIQFTWKVVEPTRLKVYLPLL